MLKEALIEGIKNTFVFKGEMSRQQFWCYWLVMEPKTLVKRDKSI